MAYFIIVGKEVFDILGLLGKHYGVVD